MNIFTDFHHAGLLNSLILLFEGRAKGRVFRPIGKKWYKKGFWKVYDHPATVEQYLGFNGATPDGSQPLNEVKRSEVFEGVYHCQDIASGGTNKAITLKGFLKHPFDFVIASIPQHIAPFRKLCDQHPDKPKLIYQIGNAWNVSPDQERMIDAILSSAKLQKEPNKPFIVYHQEFDLNIFHPPIKSYPYVGDEYFVNHYDFTPPGKKITSFVNCFNTDDLFAFDWAIFQNIEKAMPDWEFKALGGGCRDGYAKGDPGVAEEMRKSRFIWHTKNGGDGYGHIIHNTGAVGRPSIVRKSYYHGKLADDLMLDGQTCIAIDGLSEQEIINKINYYSDEDRYLTMAKKVYNNFKERVDFEKEAKEIIDFLKSLL